MEEATLARWIKDEVAPKALQIEKVIPDEFSWARSAALQAAVKPFFYWSQDQASSKAASSPSASSPSGTGSSSLLTNGGGLQTLIDKHRELVLHSGPPGTTLLIPQSRLDPATWEEVHRAAKAAVYAYVAYDKDTGRQGHWRKTTVGSQ